MKDEYGRNIDYVRISVTDRCSFRCVYCMPEEGVTFVPHEEILSFEEIIRLVRVFEHMGVHKIKLTGGEPLVRKGLSDLVYEIKKIPGITQVTLTTNGEALYEQMDDLAKAGIDAINISLDTLNPEVFEKITRKNSFYKVMEGFQKALTYPDITLKINCVPMGIENQKELEVASLARDYPVHVRFIEIMPIGLGAVYPCKKEDELLKDLRDMYGEYKPCMDRLGNGPGHYYDWEGFQGKIGFISAMSHKFCNSCNRVRLTSVGFLKTCLQYDVGVDLKGLIRKGESDDVVQQAVREAIKNKPISHEFEKIKKEHGEEKIMSQIGG